jgi:succinoglycan biosynthesis transport protein ExoP
MKPIDHKARATLGLLRVARRRRVVLALCIVLVPLAAVLFSLHQPKKYTATATLLFQDQEYAQGLFGTSSTFTPAETDPTRAAATNLSLVQQSIIAQKTAAALGDGLKQDVIQGEVAISAQGQSDLVQITATTRSAALSARIANAYANQFIEYRQNAATYQIIAAEDQIAKKLAGFTGAAKSSPAARELATRQQDLQIYASLQTGNAQLSQPAEVPTGTSSPRPVRNAVIGLLLGLLLGVGAALVLERLDQRVRDIDEFEEIFNRPLLGTIPQSRAFPAQRSAHATLTGREIEAFRTLRIHLRYFNIDREIRSVVVNSAVPGEGKSTVSWNLAAAASSSGQRVLLIEADMRRPVLAAWLGVAFDTAGLSEYLSGQQSLEDVIRTTPTFVAGNNLEDTERPKLDVIVGGGVPPNPPDLLESERLQDLLDHGRSDYDLVVIDTPPTAIVADAVHLLARVDGVIAVVRLGQSRRHHTRKYCDQLSLLDAPVLGVVVNGTNPGMEDYDYDYGYRGSYPSAVGSDATANGDGARHLAAAGVTTRAGNDSGAEATGTVEG